MKELLWATISQDAFWSVNKKLAKKIGLAEAVFLSDLISKEKYFYTRGQLDDNGGFFNTSENLETDMGISEYTKKKIQSNLVGLKLVTVKKRGVPAKNYWYLNHKLIMDIMTSQDDVSLLSQEDVRPTVQADIDPAINKNKEIITNNKNKYNIATSDEVDVSNKPLSLVTRVKYMFNEFYSDYYGESFSWGKSGAKIMTHINSIIALAGQGTDEEKMNRIQSKMIILRWYCETKNINTDYWKFTYDKLMSKWNELVIPVDKDAEQCKHLLCVWNKLTGQDIAYTPAIAQMMTVAKNRNNLGMLQKAVCAKALNQFDIDNNSRNLATLLLDKSGQIATYAGKYDDQNMSGIVTKKLKETHDSNSPFPEISHTSNYKELIKYDWMQHGVDALAKYVIGQDGYRRLKDGEKIETLIEEIMAKKISEYSKQGLVKNG